MFLNRVRVKNWNPIAQSKSTRDIALEDLFALHKPRNPLERSDRFSYVSLAEAVPLNHPIRKIKELVDPILEELWPDFDGLYASNGRLSIPPEQLLKALLLQVLFTIRSERQLVE